MTVTSLTNGSRIQFKSKNSILRPVILLELESADDKKGNKTKLTMNVFFNRKSALFQVRPDPFPVRWPVVRLELVRALNFAYTTAAKTIPSNKVPDSKLLRG